MFGFSAMVLVPLLLWTIGIVFAVVGAFSKVFDVGETIVAIAIALFVPVIGSIGAVALYIYAARRVPDPAGDAPSVDMG